MKEMRLDIVTLGDAAPAFGPRGHRSLLWDWRGWMLAAALVLGVAGRLAYIGNASFWFDETFSGVIASQRDVAAALGVSAMTVNGWERGLTTPSGTYAKAYGQLLVELDAAVREVGLS